MNEKELYRELGALTKSRQVWRENISWVGGLLDNPSTKMAAKALWLLGEMGLRHPVEVEPFVGKVASFLESPEELLRERALNALGRIGRGRFESVEPFLKRMSGLGSDGHPRVRLAFVWASENIATQTPDPYGDCLPLFAGLLHDTDDRVRMEAPEMFRVLGKRRPQMVEPYLDTLRWMAENDPHPVVRIHCAGAVRAVGKGRTAVFPKYERGTQ
jgi:HEAT repeat protein